jgi:hypothetical protein
MSVVTKRSDIISNLETYVGYLDSKKKEEQEFAINEILAEDLIIIYKLDGENAFAPARFTVHKKNDIKGFNGFKEDYTDKDVTNTMTKVVGLPFTNQGTIDKFSVYVKGLTKKKFSTDRTFWRLKDERGKNFNLVTKK